MFVGSSHFCTHVAHLSAFCPQLFATFHFAQGYARRELSVRPSCSQLQCPIPVFVQPALTGRHWYSMFGSWLDLRNDSNSKQYWSFLPSQVVSQPCISRSTLKYNISQTCWLCSISKVFDHSPIRLNVEVCFCLSSGAVILTSACLEVFCPHRLFSPGSNCFQKYSASQTYFDRVLCFYTMC